MSERSGAEKRKARRTRGEQTRAARAAVVVAAGPVRTAPCRAGCRTEVALLDAICPLCLAAAPAELRDGYDRSRRSPADIPVRFAAEDAIVSWTAQQRRAVA